MALYNVVAPCIVAGKHYTRPSAAPIEVSMVEAKPLVAAGAIQPVKAAPPASAEPDAEKPRRGPRAAKPQEGGDGQTE